MDCTGPGATVRKGFFSFLCMYKNKLTLKRRCWRGQDYVRREQLESFHSVQLIRSTLYQGVVVEMENE